MEKNQKIKLAELFSEVISCETCLKSGFTKILKDNTENLPQPGYVGSNYFKKRILLIGQNPGACSAEKRKTDRPYMDALRNFTPGSTEDDLETLLNLISEYIPTWPVHGVYFPLEECGLTLEDIAYFNLVRCRTTGNASPSKGIAINCRNKHFNRWIDFLNPSVVVCVGKYAYDHISHDLTLKNIPCDYIDRNRSLNTEKRNINRTQVANLVKSMTKSIF
jgi:uracil-DNA glycosylase